MEIRPKGRTERNGNKYEFERVEIFNVWTLQ